MLVPGGYFDLAKSISWLVAVGGAGMARQQSSRRSTSPNQPAATSSSSGPVITIHAGIAKKELFTKTLSREMPLTHLARKWPYILRVRSRWVGDAGQRDAFGAQALVDLGHIGLGRDDIQHLVTADRVEIELHDWNDADAYASIHETAAEIPWEYLISAATRAQGRFESLLISRLFRNGTPHVTPAPPRNMLFVESEPGRLKGQYDFGDEETRIRAAVGATGKRNQDMEIVRTPEISALRSKLQNENWEAIHVTGFDTHQAAWTVEGFYDVFEKSGIWNGTSKSSQTLQDGMILRKSGESEWPVFYDELAKVLAAPKPPRIVTLNLYHSGARTARELVRKGAHVSLGFLDEIDDELAELFFQSFYWAWCRPERKTLSIPEAFLRAWNGMSDIPGLHGTSIVIWLGRSIFDTSTSRNRRPRAVVAKKRATK